jgi:hypothetical protein
MVYVGGVLTPTVESGVIVSGGCGMNLAAVSLTWDDSDELALLSKLTKKISEFDVAMAVSTLPPQFRTIATCATSLAGGLRALRKGLPKPDILAAMVRGQPFMQWDPRDRRPTRRQTEDELSSTWLSLQYGWMPFISDIHDSAKLIERIMTGKIRNSWRVQHTKKVFAPSNFPGAPAEDGVATTLRHRLVYRTALGWGGLQELALISPSTIAWEVLPWSFVADWVLPVGTWLDTLRVLPTLTGDWTRSVKSEKVFTQSYWGVGIQTISPYSRKSGSFTRTVGTSGLSVPTPSWKSPISSDYRRAVNAIALLAQQRLKFTR